MNTSETYSPQQILERGRQLAMRASERIMAMLNGSGQPNYEAIDALSGAVIAGTNMMENADITLPDDD